MKRSNMKYSKPGIHLISDSRASAVCCAGSSPALGGDCTLGLNVATGTCTVGTAANTDCNLGVAASVTCVTGDSVGLGCVSGNSA